MPTVRTVIASLPALADQTASLAPRALKRIAALIDEHDGFPSRGEFVGGRTMSDTSSVERAALQLLVMPLQKDHDEITALVKDIEAKMKRVVSLSSRHLDRIDASTLRCTGGAGLPGAIEWGRPDCTDLQEADRKGGLCMACRKRRDRWQRERATAA